MLQALQFVTHGIAAEKLPPYSPFYACPLCLRPFPRSAVADGTLTLERCTAAIHGGKRSRYMQNHATMGLVASGRQLGHLDAGSPDQMLGDR